RQPQGQAIDEQRALTPRLTRDDRCQRQRRLDRVPERAAPRPMGRDAMGHLGIPGFRRRAISAARGGAFDEPFGITALARSRAAQTQTDRRAARSDSPRFRQWSLLPPRDRTSSSDAEVSWLGVIARGAFPDGLSPEPVAVAADSPLTVAGAAPVLHRTSLSHRRRHASTQQEEPPPQLLAAPAPRAGGDRGHGASARAPRGQTHTPAG